MMRLAGLWILVLAVAAPAFGQALNTRQQAQDLRERARALHRAGDYDKALILYQRIADATPRLWGAGDYHMGVAYNDLGLLHLDAGRYKIAEPYFDRAIAIWEALYGPNDPEVANGLQNLAVLLTHMGQYAKAESLFQRALRIGEMKSGPNSLDITNTLNNFAALYDDLGQFSKSEALHLRVLRICESQLGNDDLKVALTLNNLGLLYLQMGAYAKAETFIQRALRIWESKLGPDNPKVATVLGNLASLYDDTGRFAKANPLHLRSLKIREAKLDPDHPDIAISHHKLANHYGYMGLFAKALQHQERALAIWEAKHGQDHAATVIGIQGMAILHVDLKEYAKAEPLYLRAMRFYETTFGVDSDRVASVCMGLAKTYRLMKQHDKVEPLYQRAMRIRELQLGKDHPLVTDVLRGQAHHYFETGQPGKGEPLLQRVLDLQRAQLGKGHPDTLTTQRALAERRFRAGRHTEAVRQLHQCIQFGRAHQSQTLSVLAEPEQLSFLKSSLRLDESLSLAVAGKLTDENTSRTAEWLINGKSIVQQSMAERVLLARDANTAESQKNLEELTGVRQELAKLSLDPGRRDPKEVASRKEELTERERALSAQLHRHDQRAFQHDPWIEMDELTRRMTAESVYVDFIRYHVRDWTRPDHDVRWLPPRYAAWVTTPRGDTRTIDLGEATKIDAAIRRTREALNRATAQIKDIGEPKSATETQAALDELAKLILQPLRDHLQTARHWILCPDGELWLVPWAALPFVDSFVIEKHVIQLVVSGRDLIIDPLRFGQKSNQAVVVANPDFDAQPGRRAFRGGSGSGTLAGQHVHFAWLADGRLVVRSGDAGGDVIGNGTWSQDGDTIRMETERSRYEGQWVASRLSGRRQIKSQPGSNDPWSVELTGAESGDVGATLTREAGKFGPVRRLPGTAIEAEQVLPRLKTLVGANVRVLLDAQATESAVKSASRPKMLLLSTHGYFLPTQQIDLTRTRPDTRSPALPKSESGSDLENPLLRCGLLLTGCNRRDQSKASEDDGVLTGLEIVGCDLRGCELVVLSACDTGLGDVRNGEGVAGLRQAFQLAGAESVVASLWQVPDRDTALLMVSFFDNLAKGMTKAEALREAQLGRIADRRKRFGAAHPYFWAAFTVTGR